LLRDVRLLFWSKAFGTKVPAFTAPVAFQPSAALTFSSEKELIRRDNSPLSFISSRRSAGVGDNLGFRLRTDRGCGILALQCWRRHSDHERPVGNILQWFAGIAAAFTKLSDIFSRSPRPVSDIAAESRAESAAEGSGAVATATEIVSATQTATFAVAADARIGQDGQVTGVASISPDQQEIERRRQLVRALFNDFWSGSDDKPAAFADRLDQAEIYLNDRLTACGEFWQLDAKTRKLLGLPARRSTASA
jgi:hypothetical protein